MTQYQPEAPTRWLAFRCPSCRVRLRIKAAYASLRGRCPECGSRIEALQPAPPSNASSASLAEEPMGLVPVEDEWPEPARVVDEEKPGGYDLASQPPTWTQPSPPSAPQGEGYGLAADDYLPPRPPLVESDADPYAVAEPSPVAPLPASPYIDAQYQKELDLLHQPPPPPPPFPLWSGLYTFPWRGANLGVWFYLSLNYSVLALIAAAMVLILHTGGVVLIAIPLLIPVMGFIFFWTGIYASTSFLATVEDTAAGNDQVTWPKGGGLVDGLGKFLFFVWLGGCSLLPAAIFWVAHGGMTAPDDFTWVAALLPGLILFPVQLLSVLTVGSWWALLDRRIVFGLLLSPRALFLMGVPSLVLLVPCVWLAQQILLRGNFLLAVVAGFSWAAFLLIYARILGRIGWLLTGTREKRKSGRKKPRRSQVETSQTGWGDEAMEA